MRIGMIISMRTTLNIDDRLVDKAKHRAVDLGLTLSEYVNRLLGRDLSEAKLPPEPFRMVTYGNPRKRVHREPIDFARALEEEDAEALRKVR
jgi:hypothetical protein